MSGQICIFVVKNKKHSYSKYVECYTINYSDSVNIPKLGEQFDLNEYEENRSGLFKVCEKLIRYDPAGCFESVVMLKVTVVH
ncbi:MAG: hypothetical protein COA79_20720 [Planctomycetota bacterium]|nr:MAG: hypothetical protein COA79_20720 [Planctomycetota bacterium]